MRVTVEIPDEMAAQLPSDKTLARELIEAYAAVAYLSDRLSRRQVGLLLGLDRWQTEEFLVRQNANRPFTSADFALERSPDQ
jgi:hypothetical protein